MTPCPDCGGSGWILQIRGEFSSVKACACRAKASRTLPFQERGIPLSNKAAAACAALLCETLAFSPSSEMGRSMIANALVDMCHTEDEAKWVVRQACELHTTWGSCGIPGLRQIVGMLHTPKDGISVISTEAYPDGLPQKQLPGPALPALPPGRVASRDQLMESGVKMLAAAHSMDDLPELPPEEQKKAREFEKVLEAIEMGPRDRTPELPPIRRKPARQSQYVKLSNDPIPDPLPPGSYRPLTREEVEELYRKHKAEKDREAS